MRLGSPLHLLSIIIIIGIFTFPIKGFANSGLTKGEAEMMVLDQDFDPEKMTGPPNGQGGWVVVESLNTNISRETGTIELVPYRERRKPWGQYFSVGYSMFAPTNLESNTGAFGFSDIYDDGADTPLVEIAMHLKRNFKSAGSLAMEFAAGYYQNSSDVDFVDSELEIIPIRIGFSYILDTLFSKPYVAPYVTAGGYIISYSESQGTTSFKGTTQVAPYFSFGVNLDLGWLDRESADTAYLEVGLENTSIFIEGRSFVASADEADPNFETDLHGNAGLRLEF